MRGAIQDRILGPSESALLFRSSGGEIHRGISALLRSFDPSGRLTESKIARRLWTSIIAYTGGDVVAAAMLSGQDRMASKVAMFYACRNLARLQEIYGATVWRLRSQIWREAGCELPRVYQITDAADIYISKRICPTVEAVRAAVARLIDDLENAEPLITPEEVRAYHNRFTLYVLLLFGYTTGIRAKNTPYAGLGMISPLNGCAPITDKGQMKTKLVLILREHVLEQIEEYDRYIQRCHPDAATRFPCFFIRPADGSIAEVTPTLMADHLQEYLPDFPVAVHRRFSFNFLLDHGCSPESVRVWMGHARKGEEVWGPSSTFNPGRHRKNLQPYLLLLLRRLGFRLVRSRR